VSRQFDETIPITIGQQPSETVRLTTHDWRNDPVACAWNQALIRAGLECNGYWEIDIAAPGRYRFELRRWPREENRALVEGIPGELIPFHRVRTEFGGGRAIPLVRAAIQVAHHHLEQPIPAHARSITFECDLAAGETRLQTYLTDANDTTIGAYYVYVDRVDEAQGGA